MERSRAMGTRRGTGRWRGILATGGGAAVMAPVVVLLLMAPTAGASSVKTIVAPYKGVHPILANPTSVSGCGGGAQSVHAFFNATAGIGGFSDNASTKWCSAYTNNSANMQGRFSIGVPFKLKTSGVRNITALWLTVSFGGVNLTAGTCTGSSTSLYSGCTRSASAFVYGTAYLLDKTTGTHTKLSNKWLGNSTYVSNYTSCMYTRCSSTHSKTTSAVLSTGNAYWVWQWNLTSINATHNYSLKMTIFGGVTVTLSTSGGATLSGASADAQMNSATLGNKQQLLSITIS